MPGSRSATTAQFPVVPLTTQPTLTGVPTDRDQLTRLLRSLAAELDELDRRLSDLSWQQRSLTPELAATGHERAALLARSKQLTSRLRGFARELNDLDSTLSNVTGYQHSPAGRVGTCPHCGYPSLDSGLCAYCRPQRGPLT